MPSFCNICGQHLRGHYAVYRRGDTTSPKGLVVCSRCERSAPRCALCRMPMAPDTDQGGLCPTCAERTPFCSSCGKRILGGYVTNATNGAIYCETCYNHRPRCAICGGAAGQGGSQLHDGRVICGPCRATAVFDAGQAAALFQRTIDVIGRDPGLRLALCPTLSLVDRDQMLALLAQSRAGHDVPPDSVFGLFVRRGRKRTVYVESGLPQILMIQVLAHELAHAWQGENCPLLCDPLVREGFAEWVSYRALLDLGAVKKAALMVQRSDLYGQGLQLMLQWERAGGAAAVLEGCRHSEPCPGAQAETSEEA